ncbi:MAG TPA: glycosyltransferase, partial [Methylophilaceae bacterium]|nr:glycosyltransferase [Methylophilaceae bacterium]
TLHNFRLFCAQAMFMRDGRVCEDCMGTLPWRGVVRRCYRGSLAQSAVVVGMQGLHRMLGTYQNRVTRYIALNQFCSDKFVEAGLPSARMAIKPNFIDLPAPVHSQARSGALFVGRLSAEKGIATLARAIALYPAAKLGVIGTGPQQAELEGAAAIHLHGWQEPQAIYERMAQAAYLVMPSVWYENFPRTLVEAFACGLPVIASRLGAMAELVRNGETGLLFEPGDAADLAAKMQWADANPEAMQRMGQAARAEYEARYTSETNFNQLMAIYADAIQAKRGEQ